ncbi:MAG: hypothetical protein ABL993_02000 [Vicinamibacterales bacterium]
MRRLTAATLLLLLIGPTPAHAWGSEAHMFIMERAIGLLPPEIRPLFERHRAALVERIIDPDTWRTAGFGQEDPNHYLDIDAAVYGRYPFSALPRDWDAAVLKFGVERLRSNGLVPWRSAEMHGNLRRAFETYKANPSRSGQHNIVLFSAWMAHYASDAHQPFHGISNHNGQLSGQVGIHARFEATLFERYRSRLRISPTPLAPVLNPRDFIFDAVLEDTKLSPIILKADLDAIGRRDVYDDAYYEAFFTGAGGVMERRVNESIAAVAAMIAGAWEAAGRPPVPLDPPTTPERRRRP